MATCEMCGGHLFRENVCRDCDHVQEDTENVRRNGNSKVGPPERSLGKRLHTETNQPPKNENESPQGVFSFLRRR